MKGKVTVIAYHRAALLAVRAPTCAEKGCINYDLHDSLDRYSCSSKNWVSKADFDAPMQSAHIATFRALAPEPLA